MTDLVSVRWDEDDPRVEEASCLMLDEKPREAKALLRKIIQSVWNGERSFGAHRTRVNPRDVLALLDHYRGILNPTARVAADLGVSTRTVERVKKAAR